MKRLVVGVVIAAAMVVMWHADTPASAHTAIDHVYLGYSGNHSGSMLDASSLMTCDVNSGYGSIVYAATQWDASVFGPNGYLPWYTWTSTSCDGLGANSWPVWWRDFVDTCGDGCYLGITYDYGIRYVGGYGLCGTGNNFCVNATRSDVYINKSPDAGQNPANALTRQTAIHELGHPIGLGDGTSACNLSDRSIMNYDCMDNHNQQFPGPHDINDTAVLY